MKCADLTFGINPQAWAVLQLLSAVELNKHPQGLRRISTFPWFNGRERGICLVASRHPNQPCLLLAFGEDRKSDRIFVEFWEQEEPFSAPSVEGRPVDVGDAAYKARVFFPHGEVGKVTSHIAEVLSTWLG